MNGEHLWLEHDRPGKDTALRADFARRLTELPSFHPSSTADAARAARRTGERAESGAADRRGAASRSDEQVGPGVAERQDVAARRVEAPADASAAEERGVAAQRTPDQAHPNRGDEQAEVARADVGERRPGEPVGDASPADATADRPEVDYRAQVRGFELMWERHVERWPEAPRNGDRSRPDDPPGSWRGDGGRYLTPDQNAEADRLIAILHEPEKEISAIMQAIEQENPFGGRLAGLDNRLKGNERLKEKIADVLKKEVGSSVADASSAIGDAVRYTFRLDPTQYVPGHGDIKQRLEAAGCQMIYSRNHWIDDPQYNGVNTRWLSPTGGRFELQFHTADSLHAKEHLTHRSYKRLRSPETSWAERNELEDFQSAITVAVALPIMIDQIQDYGRRP